MLYLSSHFGLGYAPWEVQRAAWAASGASWMEKEWMCAGGCVGADACVGAGETPLSAAAPGQVRQRPGPNSEPKTGCSALAWAVRDLEEREREKKKTQRPVGLWVPQRRRRKSQYSPGIPCFCRSCCGGFLREDSLVEVREMPVTKYQSESPNEAGNTWLVGWMISTGWYLKTRENTMSHHSRKHHRGRQQASAPGPPPAAPLPPRSSDGLLLLPGTWRPRHRGVSGNGPRRSGLAARWPDLPAAARCWGVPLRTTARFKMSNTDLFPLEVWNSEAYTYTENGRWA